LAETINLEKIELFCEPDDRLLMTHDDRSWPTVVPRWASPLKHPNRYLSLLDGKGNEIVTITDPEKELGEPNRGHVLAEVRRRYLTALVESVVTVKGEWGATYWVVETDRGRREFVTQSLQENAQWLGASHILLTDVDGNRFELKDIENLDERSRKLIHSIL
jgi:hypothetical protein